MRSSAQFHQNLKCTHFDWIIRPIFSHYKFIKTSIAGLKVQLVVAKQQELKYYFQENSRILAQPTSSCSCSSRSDTRFLPNCDKQQKENGEMSILYKTASCTYPSTVAFQCQKSGVGDRRGCSRATFQERHNDQTSL